MRLFVLAFVGGTLALQHAAELPQPRLFIVAIAPLLALALVRRHRAITRGVLLLAAGALAGAGLAAWRADARLSDALPRSLEGADIDVVGVVASLPQVTDAGTRFLFDVEEVATPGATVPQSIGLAWYAERVKGGDAIPPPALLAGERWRLTVRLKRPRGLSNPHAFDFEPWALERDIRATGYVRAQPPPRLLDARVGGWPYTLHRWRGEIRESMAAHLGDARLRGVLVALAIGDQDSIAADDWDVFWRTGVGHLMSISGLHITMLAALASLVTFRLWVRVPHAPLRWPARKAAVAVGVVVAAAYSLMTGYAVPAQRTFVMLATVAACVLCDRHASGSRVLALAAFAVILVDPWAVLSPGFWLSFGAVASIFYVMALRTGRPGRLRAAMLEQLAVGIVMLPALLALFQQVSLVSPIANAVAIPVVSLVVVPLSIAGAFLPLPWLLDAAHAVMVALMLPLEWLAALPMAMLETHEPAPWTVALGALGCAWLLAPRGFPMRAAGAAWTVPMFAVLPPAPAFGEAWLDVLDVGNGLAVSVRTSAHALAYDTGPSWNADVDGGNRIVVPFLRGEGVSRLDGVVISHADDDHSGGALSVAESRDPAWLLSPLPDDHALHGMFERSIRCEAGTRWRWDGVDFVVLHPHADVYAERDTGRRARKENDRSCVLRVATGGGAALLTGDAEARAEAEMIERDAPALRADVLVVPHHGSKTSSTEAFIDAVAPSTGVLSVGYRNRFHHPNATVVARYTVRRIALRRTDAEGALRIVLPREAVGARVEALLRDVRYWSERRGEEP